MERIELLRKDALNNVLCADEFFYKFYKSYKSSSKELMQERYADAYYDAFTSLTPHIAEGELIVGRICCFMSSDEQKEWDMKYSDITKEQFAKAGGGQDSHMAIDYELLLSLGINGIVEKIDEYLKSCDEEKMLFYNTCKRCLEAVVKHSLRYAEYAERLAGKEPNPERKAELVKIAEICRKVPAQPAESFYEAVQSVNFITYCMSLNPFRYCWQQFQLGHPDRYLLPFYNKDIESGVITKEYAQLLINCMAVQINNRVPNGLSNGYMVGGRDSENNVVANELTYMLMQAVDDVRLVYPSVGLCYTEGMDSGYLEKACEILSHGRSHPAIFNDDIITKGMKSYGVPDSDAHNYIHSTCVEITPVAASNVWVASPYTNMPQLLLDCMDREYADFNEMLSAVFAVLDASIKNNFEGLNNTRKVRSDNSMNPILSCFVNDCLSRGKDIEQGGAKYNWIMPSFVGIANLVDSLYVLKEVVFGTNEFTIGEIKNIIDNNFDGNEALRLRFLNSVPKYGNDIDDVDKYFGMITEHIIAECEKYEGMHSNGNIIPSAFCWIKHEAFGKITGATPDGRMSGFPLGDGSGPCQGREMNGPTASIISATKWAHHKLIGGVAVNMKFSKKSLGENSVATMVNLVKTYMQRGGFEMQINVVDKETLEKAMEHPEEYRDLVVRIGGYSDYFVTLSPEMQQEVMLRTEHKI